jgi:sortase A
MKSQDTDTQYPGSSFSNNKERPMKKKRYNIVLTVAFFIGLSLLLYPTVSDYWNSFHQTRAIADYAESVAELADDNYEEILNQAEAYNEELLNLPNRFTSEEDEEAHEAYEEQLNVSDTGIIGYVEIPSISVKLPIYHGTDEGVLQVAVGHIEGSSLPVGGPSTHCVLSGHRGLPSAKLFTDLDQLVEGDYFMLQVLDETLTYEVDQILIVEPNDLEPLAIEEGKDYCTLVTCTPYGINTQRLLVRGHRVANLEEAEEVRVTADATQIENVLVAPFLAAPIILILLILLFVTGRKR